MAKNIVHTEVGGRKIRLTNLEKIIYPIPNISKAEIIQYYLSISSNLLGFGSGRPLTLIRYPDGIDGQSFYSKNTPDYTPDWVVKRTLPWDQDNLYSFLSNTEDLAWFANLVALELHVTSSRYPDITYPDHFVLDLDPGSDVSFDELKITALNLKTFLEERRFTVYIKTSGSKGLHLVLPLVPDTAFDEVMDYFKALFGEYVRQYPETTLKISKEKRIGKILLDIYRNHRGNTTVAPFSLRARPEAPISMPFPWSYLDHVKDAMQFTLRNYTDYPQFLTLWKDMSSRAVSLRLDQDTIPESLHAYQEKRNFGVTTEPLASSSKSVNDKFVLHLHDATNLHYDLRLGIDGVLKSWAIPKALPHQSGLKRLCIQTEDHPSSYLNYEGNIPEGQYGAGDMWIMDSGVIEWIEQKHNKYEFRLIGQYISEVFSLFKTKNDQWLISLNQDNKKSFELEIFPMLAVSADKLMSRANVFYEVKWDGIRVCVVKEDDSIKLLSRSGRDITSQFPELVDPVYFEVEHCILDGEIVVLDEGGRPLFSEVISRMHGQNNLTKGNATCYVFDCLAVDRIPLTQLGIERRRDILQCILHNRNYYRYSDTFDDGEQLLQAVRAQSMEGIMMKVKGSTYQAGQRSKDWQKLKIRSDDSCFIIGYTKGSGDRSPYFGSLVLAVYEDDSWIYRGRVGTGFDTESLIYVTEQLKKLDRSVKLLKERIDEENNTIWVSPQLECSITYASMSSNKTFREPVFNCILNPIL